MSSKVCITKQKKSGQQPQHTIAILSLHKLLKLVSCACLPYVKQHLTSKYFYRPIAFFGMNKSTYQRTSVFERLLHVTSQIDNSSVQCCEVIVETVLLFERTYHMHIFNSPHPQVSNFIGE